MKNKRKTTERHIPIDELTEPDRFQKLSTRSKYLIDTIKMIAYHAETSMAILLRGTLSRPDEARRLLQTLCQSEADLLPDKNNKALTVCLHHMANRSSDQAIQQLCDKLNETETIFPQTDLRMIFKLGVN